MKVPEEMMLEAMLSGHEEIKKMIAFQEEIADKLVTKRWNQSLLFWIAI